MSRQNVHRALTVLLLGTIVLFSMGYTTVLRYCSMSQSTDCCCESVHRHQGTPGAGGHSIAAEFPWCYSVTVLGGVHDTNVTVSPSYSASIQLDEVPFDVAPDDPPALCAVSMPALRCEDLAPPGAEICIRTGSLLI